MRWPKSLSKQGWENEGEECCNFLMSRFTCFKPLKSKWDGSRKEGKKEKGEKNSERHSLQFSGQFISKSVPTPNSECFFAIRFRFVLSRPKITGSRQLEWFRFRCSNMFLRLIYSPSLNEEHGTLKIRGRSQNIIRWAIAACLLEKCVFQFHRVLRKSGAIFMSNK